MCKDILLGEMPKRENREKTGEGWENHPKADPQGKWEEMCHQEGGVTWKQGRLHPHEVSWWARAAGGGRAACGRSYKGGLEKERKNRAGVMWGPQLTGCFLSVCEVPSGGSEKELREACRDLIIGAGSQVRS